MRPRIEKLQKQLTQMLFPKSTTNMSYLFLTPEASQVLE